MHPSTLYAVVERLRVVVVPRALRRGGAEATYAKLLKLLDTEGTDEGTVTVREAGRLVAWMHEARRAQRALAVVAAGVNRDVEALLEGVRREGGVRKRKRDECDGEKSRKRRCV